MPVLPKTFHDPNKALSIAFTQPSPSNMETVTENKSLRLAPWQAEILNNFFNNTFNPTCHNPTKEEIKILSLQIERTEKSVKRWFNYKVVELNKKKNTTTKNLTQKQLKTLVTFFENKQRPNENEFEELSNASGLSVRRIKNWFVLKRVNTKKESQKNNNKQRLIDKNNHCEKIYKRFTKSDNEMSEMEYEKRQHADFEEEKSVSEEYGLDDINNWFNMRRSINPLTVNEVSRTELGPCTSFQRDHNSFENIYFDNSSSELVNQANNRDLTDLTSWHHPRLFLDDEIMSPGQQTNIGNYGNDQFIFGQKNIGNLNIEPFQLCQK